MSKKRKTRKEKKKAASRIKILHIKRARELKLKEYQYKIRKLNLENSKKTVEKVCAFSTLTFASLMFLLSLKNSIPNKNISSYQKKITALEEEKKEEEFYHYIKADNRYYIEHISNWYPIGKKDEYARLHYFSNPIDYEDNNEYLEIGKKENSEIIMTERISVEEIKEQVNDINKTNWDKKYYSFWIMLYALYLRYIKMIKEPNLEERKEYVRKLMLEIEDSKN